MPHDRLDTILASEVRDLQVSGIDKGREQVILEVVPGREGRGPRLVLAGSDLEYIRMNSNGYLGLAAHPRVVAAEERATRQFGAGPGAVRFISGTYAAHVGLEARLAGFHGRERAMVFSSAYATVLSVLTALITPDTAVLSDELNHNCIINALRLARPAAREVYPHLDFGALDAGLTKSKGARRAIVVTDGVFSMRGDHADLATISEVARAHDADFPENVVVVVDDSHGVAAFGPTGRGTEEMTGSAPVDVLIGTLGKGFGVNGGYVTGSDELGSFLREKSPMYIYSNPITVGEAAAAHAAVEVVDSAEGRARLAHLGRDDQEVRGGVGRTGVGDHPRPAPGCAADGAGHRAHLAARRAPL